MDNVIRKTLSNGLRVIFLKKPISSASIVISVGTGYLNEKTGFIGVSHLLEHLLFDGTKSWPSEFVFNDAAEQLGGNINGTTNEFSTSYELRVAEEDFEEAIRLMADLIQEPLITGKDIEKEKKVIKAELLSRKDYFKKNPVKTVLYSFIDGIDPIKHINLELAELSSLNEKKIKSYYQSNYFPKNITVGIVGNMSDPFNLVEKYFSKSSTFSSPNILPKFIVPKKTVKKVKDVDSVASTYFCWFGPSSFDEDRAVFEVCAKILSKGENGIVKAIRFDKGLAYEVDASIHTDERKGVFVISVKTSKENLVKVEKIVGEKIALLATVSSSEVEKAKKSVLAQNILQMEDYIELAKTISDYELYNKPTPYEGYFERIKSINLEMVRAFARKNFKDDFVVITSKIKK